MLDKDRDTDSGALPLVFLRLFVVGLLLEALDVDLRGSLSHRFFQLSHVYARLVEHWQDASTQQAHLTAGNAIRFPV